MERKAIIIRSAEDGKRHIAVDSENAEDIQQFLKDNNLTKRFDLICTTILLGIRNSELYDKEDINAKCKDVTAIKFKGSKNTRIYCKEVKQKNKTLVIVTSELLPKKKNQKNQQQEIALITKVASYDYQIEE